ncbi:efflux RND transporter permease subunit [Tautonia sociabilis]|uniref:Efflux RND transporter permease subunit n=1 Tax=Tautonia sociabilis TaxID=2080755 RepID=A0A432MQ39_9BACT|nr:efflux RND transporter permease subunit [Tautonia sociabilis]RUL89128.1 efflux RND transporter permease subunit [Tautonia sociabilis]
MHPSDDSEPRGGDLIAACVSNKVKVAVGVLLVALFGSIALLTMPTQLTPEVQVPTITVETRWPGASPQEVERQIVLEQEEQLKSVEGVVEMTSEATDSRARITLEFSVGTDLAESLLKVSTRLQQVPEYPEDADEPVISTSSLSDRPIARYIIGQVPAGDDEIRAFIAEHPDLEDVLGPALRTEHISLRLFRLRRAAQDHPEVAALLPEPFDVSTLRKFSEDVVEPRLERVPGVADAETLGGREVEMQVIVDPERLAARQLTIADVRDALRNQNVDTSGGDFWEGKRRYVVRTLGQFRSPEQVGAVIIARRDDAPVYVRDVAEVQIGYRKPDSVVRRYGESVISLAVQRETGANVLEVLRGLDEAMAELNAGVLKPMGVQLMETYDETDYIYSAIDLVQNNIIIGGLLTVAVLLVFLRSGRSTLVIGLAIPTSIVGTFLILSLLGRSLNVISLAGLAFAVGMLVDNAVVVLENIYQHRERGDRVMKAAVRGTKEVWGAVLSSTLTTLAVFLPVLFIEEEAGQLFRDIALAISAAVGLSLVVSITVIPTAAAAILRDRKKAPAVVVGSNGATPHLGSGRNGSPATAAVGQGGRSWRSLLSPLDALGRRFVALAVAINRWLLGGLTRRLVTAAVLVVGAIGVSSLLLPKVEYLPSGNRNLVFGIVQPPPGYNLDQLMAMGEEIQQALAPSWDVDPGSAEARNGEYPMISDFFFVARGRQIFMGLRSSDPLRAADLIPLVRGVGKKIPGSIVVAKQSSLFESGITAGRTVEIEIIGPDLEKLVDLGGRVLGQVNQLIPDVQARPVPSLDLSSPEVHVIPKWEQAADLGVNAADLGYIVDALVDGAYASDYYRGGEKIDLTLIGRQRFATRTQDLQSLAIATPSGQLVPLAAVADVQLRSGPEQIDHRERQRAITIEVTPPPEVPLEAAMDLIRSEIVLPLEEGGELDGTTRINLSGTADKLRQTWNALRWNVLLALIITYLLMAALFESWLYPLVIILSVPLGAVGGLAGLKLLNLFVLQPLDVLTMLGFVILIGTVVNNPILIVHQALIHIREEGMPTDRAIVEAVRSRIRPIFMTTTTTVLGLLPLVLFPGAGSELYRGLGSVVLGGLIASTVFTIILVPTLFSLALQARDGLARLLGRSVEAEAGLIEEPQPIVAA